MFATTTVYLLLVLLGTNFVKCKNVTRTCEPLINIYQIAEFHLDVIGLIERAPRISEYTSFFDESLRVETQCIFARIRGFARNETQANQWMKEAHGFLRVFTLRIIATEGNAHLDVYYAQQRANSSGPATLLEQSVRRVNGQIKEILDSDFAPPYVTDEILLYELIHLSRLRIKTVNINSAPYFQLRLITPVPQRFIDRNQPGNSSPSASPSHPRPYMPLENYLEDCETLLKAYNHMDFSRVLYDLRDMFHEPLQGYVNIDVWNYAREHIKSFSSHKIQLIESVEIIRWSFFQILAKFLSANYNWLLCHPAYKEYDKDNTRVWQIIKRLETAQKRQLMALTAVRKFSIVNVVNIDFLGLSERFIAFLEGSGVVVRYVMRDPYIMISFFHARNQTNC